MIAASREVGYIWEPLNPAHDPGLFRVPIQNFYTYISDHNNAQYESAMRDLLRFRYNPLARMKGAGTLRDVAAALFHAGRYSGYRFEGRRPLLKDPLALFSAEWLADRFDAQVVVLIRHPAAFVNSLMKANWRHPFGDFLQQPKLMEECLAPFRAEIEAISRQTTGVVEEAILLWRLMHQLIFAYQRRRPDWLFVRHEDLSRDPIRQFESLFRFLGLEYEPGVQRFIEDSTRPGNPVERPGEPWPAFMRLDSRRNVNRWTERLTSQEIERIKVGTADVWPHFYDESDWLSQISEQISYGAPQRIALQLK